MAANIPLQPTGSVRALDRWTSRNLFMSHQPPAYFGHHKCATAWLTAALGHVYRHLRLHGWFVSHQPPAYLPAYFGHHKCATAWLTAVLRDVCRQLRLKAAYLPNDQSFGGDLPRFLEQKAVGLLLYVNAEIKHVRRLPDFRGFHVVRDPRDLVVSAYFSHRYSHPMQPWLVEHRARLEKLDKDEGLMCEMQFPITCSILDQIRRWDYEQRNVLEVRLEDLSHSPERTFTEAIRFLDLPIRDRELDEIIRRHSFDSKSGGRTLGQEDATSHYRKGVPGDWVNHFSERHRSYFKEHFQDILEKLGYVTSSCW